MSESVMLTIVTQEPEGQRDGVLKNRTDSRKTQENVPAKVEVTHDLHATLMSTLLENHLISGNFCGGRGGCGRCRVQFLKAAPLPTSIERKLFSPEEMRAGFRLACMAKPKNDCTEKLWR
ncbi:MAG: 2Fe-2S iron-sulfur cluster binding domain-containing protein [Lachnospiraceae bacterium]|nr:2Fe-2S iron-sulfur cluster binding domain-containing protein [Lachnospiraceae bacterium]